MSLEDELLDPSMACALSGDFDQYRRDLMSHRPDSEDSETSTSRTPHSGVRLEELVREFAAHGSNEFRIEHRFPTEAEGVDVPANLIWGHDSSTPAASTQTIRFTPCSMGLGVSDAFAWKTRKMISELFSMAERGTPAAARSLTMISIELITGLNDLALRRPALFQSLTQHLGAWPVMMSQHPELTEDPKRLFGALQLGAKSKWKDNQFSKLNVTDAAGRWSIHLFQRVATTRAQRALGLRPPEGSPQWVLEAHRIEDFGPDSWETWWRVAAQLLAEEYVDVVEIEALAKRPRGKARMTPGRLRASIKTRLRSRFKSLAQRAS